MIAKRIHSLIARILKYEQSPGRLAFTCALGIYIGISPLVGFHTAMVFLLGWLFALPIPLLFAVSTMIHNPWTMMPVYAIDHIFGKWLCNMLHIDYLQWDPAWVESCNIFLKEHTGIAGLSFFAFFVGGNLLAFSMSILLYPIMKWCFTYCIPGSTACHIADPIKNTNILLFKKNLEYENNNTK